MSMTSMEWQLGNTRLDFSMQHFGLIKYLNDNNLTQIINCRLNIRYIIISVNIFTNIYTY